jgi:hypothetical protein
MAITLALPFLHQLPPIITNYLRSRQFSLPLPFPFPLQNRPHTPQERYQTEVAANIADLPRLGDGGLKTSAAAL